MNKAQRLTLKFLLALDGMLILFPPFELPSRFGDVGIGYHWLPYLLFGKYGIFGQYMDSARIDLVRLVAEIAIVSIIGLTAFVLARDVADARTASALLHLSRIRIALSLPKHKTLQRYRRPALVVALYAVLYAIAAWWPETGLTTLERLALNLPMWGVLIIVSLFLFPED